MFLQADRYLGYDVVDDIAEDDWEIISPINELATSANKELSENRLGPLIDWFPSPIIGKNHVSCPAFEI